MSGFTLRSESCGTHTHTMESTCAGKRIGQCSHERAPREVPACVASAVARCIACPIISTEFVGRRPPGKADGWDHRKIPKHGTCPGLECPTPASALGKPFVRHHESSQFMGGSIRRVVLMVSL